MSARKKQRTARSSARAAAPREPPSLRFCALSGAEVPVDAADAGKAPGLREQASGGRIDFATDTGVLEKLRDYLRSWDGAAVPVPGPAWLERVVDLPPSGLVDLCAAASKIGLSDLVARGGVFARSNWESGFRVYV